MRRLGPSEVELMPFPFPGDRLEVDVECVHLVRPTFRSDDELRTQVLSADPEIRRTAYQICRA